MPSFVLLGCVVACGGGEQTNPRDAADANDLGRTLAPRTAAEESILKQVGQLPANTPSRLGEAVIVAEPVYHSASGRTCRALSITAGKADPTRRLACYDGKTWFFVPDVLGLNTSPEE